MKLCKAVREPVAVFGLLSGLGFLIAGIWIWWDFINFIVRYFVDWAKFTREFKFYAPLFVYEWDAKTWTGVLDLGFTFFAIGIVLLLMSGYILGRFRD